MRNNLITYLVLISVFGCLAVVVISNRNNTEKIEILKNEYIDLCELYYNKIKEANIVQQELDIENDLIYLRLHESDCNGCKLKIIKSLQAVMGDDQFIIVTDINIGLTEKYDDCIEKEIFIEKLDRLAKPYIVYFDAEINSYVYFLMENDFDVLNHQIITLINHYSVKNFYH